MSAGGPVAARWSVDLPDRAHAVELEQIDLRKFSGTPRHFTADGTTRSFGSLWTLRFNPRTISFDLGGRPATISVRRLVPSFANQFMRVLRGGARRTLILFSYELVVDGHSQGTWVLTVRGGAARSWAFFPPGTALPDPNAVA